MRLGFIGFLAGLGFKAEGRDQGLSCRVQALGLLQGQGSDFTAWMHKGCRVRGSGFWVWAQGFLSSKATCCTDKGPLAGSWLSVPSLLYRVLKYGP